MQGNLDHIVLNVENTEVMLGFYVGVLQLAPERVDAFEAGEVLFPSIRLSEDTVIDLMPPAMWESDHPDGPGSRGWANLNHFCINLTRSDWEAALTRIAEAGRDLEAGPMTLWGARGQGTSVYVRDPEGNRFELRTYD